ncbi:cysteine hydrolase family protein [Robiginitalea sp. IMCC43444]|uniref:cysteine hydrolase family protein n=1 Tax=Robiginitalea sp. IMCC43444 TaxID=3459121 RepID=UPI0040427861
MKTAILIIDMLNDYFQDGKLADHRKILCDKINELTGLGREIGFDVIWVRQEFKKDLSDAFLIMREKNISKTIEKTEGSQILNELIIHENDYEIVKKRYSAFYKTKLDEILSRANIEQLIICGINTHACVRMAAIDAYQRDIKVIIATDCVKSYDEEHHKITLGYLGSGIASLMGNEEIKNKF